MKDGETAGLPSKAARAGLARDCIQLIVEATEQISCRRCERTPHSMAVRYIRRESMWSPVSHPGVEPEVGLALGCKCDAVHLGLPLPVRERPGERWRVKDTAVNVLGSVAPVLDEAPETTRRRRSRSYRTG